MACSPRQGYALWWKTVCLGEGEEVMARSTFQTQSPRFPLRGLTGGQGTAREVVQPEGLRATMDCCLLCVLHRKPQKAVPSHSLHPGL